MKDEQQDKRTAALKATLELISEQGFHAAPMSQIAERANIGVGTIYRYFEDKDHLINALYIDLKTRFTQCILENYSEDLPVRESFKIILGNIVRYCIAHPKELLFAEQYENSPLITAATHSEASRIAEPVVSLFKRAAEQGLLKPLPFGILGALIYGAVISLVKHQISDAVSYEEGSLDSALDAIWDMISL